MELNMDWTQAITIIGSVIVPMMAGFAWIIHRMDAKFDKVDAKFEKVEERMDGIEKRMNGIENRLVALEMRVGFIERILEIMRFPLKSNSKEITDP